ncbi:MAG: methyltransferase family protein, partial [Bacteroidota bacterium]
MNDDNIFRIILIVGFLILMPIGLYHRLKSQATGEKLDRRQEGLFILLTLRPLGLMTMAGLIVYMVNPAAMAWSSVSLPTWLRWTGVVIGVMAGFLFTWTFRSIGKNITDTVVTRKDHTLVTTGPYRWVRHPFYVTTALAIVANAAVAANAFILITGILALALIVLRTKKEEELLVARFGEEYE